MSEIDWLSHLLQMITVTGQLEVRCTYGAPWRVAWPRQRRADSLPCRAQGPGHHRGSGDTNGEGAWSRRYRAAASRIGARAARWQRTDAGADPRSQRAAGWMLSENDGQGEHLDMLCGRFFIAPPHDRLIRDYLPTNLVVRARARRRGSDGSGFESPGQSRGADAEESAGDKPGRHAILNALSSALFTLVLREASESEQAPEGLLALAGHPRLAPAISAMFADPARSWNLPDLASLCSMSRATFMRHFQDKLGRSATDLSDRYPDEPCCQRTEQAEERTEAVAESVGYQSVSAFRRVFADRMGMTPGTMAPSGASGAIGPASPTRSPAR